MVAQTNVRRCMMVSLHALTGWLLPNTPFRHCSDFVIPVLTDIYNQKLFFYRTQERKSASVREAGVKTTCFLRNQKQSRLSGIGRKSHKKDSNSGDLLSRVGSRGRQNRRRRKLRPTVKRRRPAALSLAAHKIALTFELATNAQAAEQKHRGSARRGRSNRQQDRALRDGNRSTAAAKEQ